MAHDDEFTRIAYHECGHVIMAEYLGGQTDLLTIAPDSDPDDLPERSGEFRVLWTNDDGASDKDIALREIKIALAGPVAEMIYDGTQFTPDFLEEWRHDWQMATERAKAYLPKTTPISEHLGRTIYEIIEFFERDHIWAALASLADALEAHETLEPDDIAEVLEAWPIQA